MSSDSASKNNLPARGNIVHQQKANKFFYGWIIVITTTLIMTIVYGSNFSFSVFLKPLAEGFGWSRASTSGAFAISLWTSGLLAVLMGALTDRYGPRIIIAIASFLGGFGYLLLSGTSTLWHLYAGFIVISINTSATWTPIIATVSRWFSKRRVLALGIVTAGIGLGQMLMPPLAAYLIEANGWRTAYIILAIMIWVIVIPAAIPTRHSPRDMGLLPDGTKSDNKTPISQDEHTSVIETEEWSSPEAVRTLAFWLLLALNIVLAATLFIASIHIAAYATDAGITATAAATILTFMGGANILSKVVAGTIAAKIGTRFTLLLFLILEAIALFSLSVTSDFWMLCFVAALFGFGFGGGAPPLAAMVAEFFGLRSVGMIMGLLGVGWAAGCALGTFMGDYIFDISSSYSMAFLAGGALTIMAIMIILLLRTPKKPWRT